MCFSKLFRLFCLLLVAFNFCAQSIEIVVPWTEPKQMKHGDQDFLVPTINHQVSNTGIPFFSFRAPLKSFGFKAEVNSISTSPASETEINFLSQFGIDLATEAKPCSEVETN